MTNRRKAARIERITRRLAWAFALAVLLVAYLY